MTAPDDLGPRHQRREERARRGIAAAVGLAREHGLRVAEPRVLADYFSAMVHLYPTPVVARVSTWTGSVRTPVADYLAREIDVTTYLSGQGAPVVTPSGELPSGPHVRDGFGVSFWTHLEPQGDPATPADCAAMLVDLHAALRTYPGVLPVLGPAASDIPRGLEALDHAADILSAAEADRVRHAVQRLGPFLNQPAGEVRALHGDVHPANLLPTQNGFVWIDFEDVCQGPAEWDMALLAWADKKAVTSHHRPDPDILAHCSDLRALQIVLWMLMFRDDFADDAHYDTFIRDMLPLVSDLRKRGPRSRLTAWSRRAWRSLR